MVVRARMTVGEFEQVAHSLGPCELVRGEVVPLSPASFSHSRVVSRVTRYLEEWAETTQRGRVLAGEAGIYVEQDPDTVRGADVAYISFERLPRGSEPRGFLRTPPELAVEVLGIDYRWNETIEKTGEYLKMGVLRVWVVDPQEQRVSVYTNDAAPRVLNAEDELTDEAVLSGFRVRVAALFA